MVTRLDVTGTAAATLVVLSMILAGGGIVFAAQPVAANHDSPGDYEVVLPDEDDHLPGDQNPASASIQHFAAIDDGFGDAPADELEVWRWLVISSDEVDFSSCDSANTDALGIDRGNNNEGTENDESILQNMQRSGFEEDRIFVEFNSEEDFGDTVGISADDAIVAVQSDCYTMPEEEGWYQIDGMVNGTTPDGEFMEVTLTSHYFPICEGCHDEETAEEELGAPPSQQNGGEETETPTPEPATDTPTPEATDEPTTDTPTPEATDEPTTDTPTPEATDEPTTDTPTPTEATGGTGDGDEGPMTPAPDGQAGFGPAVVLIALLASAFLFRRR